MSIFLETCTELFQTSKGLFYSRWTETPFSYTYLCAKTPIDTGVCVEHCDYGRNQLV